MPRGLPRFIPKDFATPMYRKATVPSARHNLLKTDTLTYGKHHAAPHETDGRVVQTTRYS